MQDKHHPDKHHTSCVSRPGGGISVQPLEAAVSDYLEILGREEENRNLCGG